VLIKLMCLALCWALEIHRENKFAMVLTPTELTDHEG
jgi:hypothetical protein